LYQDDFIFVKCGFEALAESDLEVSLFFFA